MYELRDILAIQIYHWEEDRECTHVIFRDGNVYCSDRGLLNADNLDD